MRLLWYLYELAQPCSPAQYSSRWVAWCWHSGRQYRWYLGANTLGGWNEDISSAAVFGQRRSVWYRQRPGTKTYPLSRFDLWRWHTQQSTCPLVASGLPPCATGMM
jgi:hypothetical protein